MNLKQVIENYFIFAISENSSKSCTLCDQQKVNDYSHSSVPFLTKMFLLKWSEKRDFNKVKIEVYSFFMLKFQWV